MSSRCSSYPSQSRSEVAGMVRHIGSMERGGGGRRRRRRREEAEGGGVTLTRSLRDSEEWKGSPIKEGRVHALESELLRHLVRYLPSSNTKGVIC